MDSSRCPACRGQVSGSWLPSLIGFDRSSGDFFDKPSRKTRLSHVVLPRSLVGRTPRGLRRSSVSAFSAAAGRGPDGTSVIWVRRKRGWYLPDPVMGCRDRGDGLLPSISTMGCSPEMWCALRMAGLAVGGEWGARFWSPSAAPTGAAAPRPARFVQMGIPAGVILATSPFCARQRTSARAFRPGAWRILPGQRRPGGDRLIVRVSSQRHRSSARPWAPPAASPD